MQINYKIIFFNILLSLLFLISCTPFQKEIKQENKINYYKSLFTYINDSVDNTYNKIGFYSSVIDTIIGDNTVFQKDKKNKLIAQVYDYMSTNYLIDNNLDSAMFFIDKAIDTDSLNFSLYYNRGCIAQNCNLDSIAIENYNIFLKNYNASSTTYYNLALIYYKHQEYEKSLDNLKLALDYNSNIKPLIYNNMGTTYFQIGDYEKAIDSFNTALKLDSTVVNAYVNAGDTYLKLNNKELAMQMFKKVLNLKDEKLNSIAAERIKDISLDEMTLNNLK